MPTSHSRILIVGGMVGIGLLLTTACGAGAAEEPDIPSPPPSPSPTEVTPEPQAVDLASVSADVLARKGLRLVQPSATEAASIPTDREEAIAAATEGSPGLEVTEVALTKMESTIANEQWVPEGQLVWIVVGTPEGGFGKTGNLLGELNDPTPEAEPVEMVNFELVDGATGQYMGAFAFDNR